MFAPTTVRTAKKTPKIFSPTTRGTAKQTPKILSPTTRGTAKKRPKYFRLPHGGQLEKRPKYFRLPPGGQLKNVQNIFPYHRADSQKMTNHLLRNPEKRPGIFADRNLIRKNLGTFVRSSQKVVGHFFAGPYVRTSVRPKIGKSENPKI